jgi:pimeloyl-ACP methyl ester carboxylesterase
MVAATSADGTDVINLDQGSGPDLLILHGGLSDESAYDKVAAKLTDRFRVVRVRRRIYRLELPVDPAISFARQVDDVLAVARAIDEPVLLMGHSSGAILALETLVADPTPFVGAAFYEPPIVTDGPVGGDALGLTRTALAAGKPGRALSIFLRRMVA